MKPELAKITAPSERVQKLRKYYSENSAMVLDRTLAPWKCSHSRLLYAEGWAKNADAPTVVFRRSMAEKYMLENLDIEEIKQILQCKTKITKDDLTNKIAEMRMAK